jgi:outer membrane immunogenic protein
MKKLLASVVSLAALANTALAAYLPSRKKPIVAAPPAPMWPGFHVGLDAGGA